MPKTEQATEIVYHNPKCSGLRGPRCFTDTDGISRLYFVSSTAGEICSIEPESKKSNFEVKYNTGGQPNDVAFDNSGNLFAADLAYFGILKMEGAEPQTYVKDYEKKSLKGPNQIAFDSKGTLFFTDSGALGETTLAKPRGGVFCVEGGEKDQVLRPLVMDCLAHPSGICVSPDDKCIFVCETLQNRLLRFVENSFDGYQILVARGDLVTTGSGAAEKSNSTAAGSSAPKGFITALSSTGEILYEVGVPQPELSGLALSSDESKLYITESSTGTIYSLSV